MADGGSNEDGCMGGSDLEGEGKQVLVGVCAMAKKSQSKPMKEILTRLEEFEYIKIVVFPEEVILKVHCFFSLTSLSSNDRSGQHLGRRKNELFLALGTRGRLANC